MFLAYLVLDRIADRMLARSETADGIANGGVALVVVGVLSAVAAALAVNVVRRIGAWQSTPGFVTPPDVISPSSFGPAPVDLARPPAPPITPPADDPRWGRPE